MRHRVPQCDKEARGCKPNLLLIMGSAKIAQLPRRIFEHHLYSYG